MKKKLLMLVTICALVLIVALSLTACNSYKWNKISGGDANAASLSNGGYVVEQGNYVYFINGYVGTITSNKWGDAYKQSIMRCEKNADGSYDNDSAVVVVPKSIYYDNTKAGFAIFGNFIYYATPNTEKDTSGVASTTHIDFMRTSLDGQITQRIATLNSRSNDFIFTPTRILYYVNNTINYIDFSGMNTTKKNLDKTGAVSGVLADRVTTYAWGYDNNYTKDQGEVISDYVVFTQSLSNSYEKYNLLKAVKYDGSKEIILATNTTYLTQVEIDAGYSSYPEKVFTFSIKQVVFESDSQATIYYSKSINQNQTTVVVGTFMNKITLTNGFKIADEKRISTQDIATLYGISYDKGCVTVADSNYYYFDGTNSTLAIGKSVTYLTHFEKDNNIYLYYSDTDRKQIFRVGVITLDNEKSVITETRVDAKYDMDFVGNRAFYFAENDYSYIHYVDLDTFTGAEEIKSAMLGKRNSEDQEAYDKAQKEAEAK